MSDRASGETSPADPPASGVGPSAEPSTAVRNGLIGGVVALVLFFVPFSTALGGGIAGYLEGPETDGGAKAGVVAGLVVYIPVVFAGVTFLGSAGPPGSVASTFATLGGLVAGAFYAVGFGLLGGVAGSYLRRNRLEARRRSVPHQRTLTESIRSAESAESTESVDPAERTPAGATTGDGPERRASSAEPVDDPDLGSRADTADEPATGRHVDSGAESRSEGRTDAGDEPESEGDTDSRDDRPVRPARDRSPGSGAVGGETPPSSEQTARGGRERAPNTLLNGAIGGVAVLVLSFIPFSPVLGGAVAGYLEGGTYEDGGKVGLVAGLVVYVPLLLLAAMFVGVVGVFAGPPVLVAMLFLSFGAFVGAVYFLGLAVLGGVVGIHLREKRA